MLIDKMRKYIIILVPLLLALAAVLLMSNNENPTATLDKLKSECTEAARTFDYKSLYFKADEYTKEAERSSEMEHLAYARMFGGVADMFWKNSHRAEKKLQQAIILADKMHCDPVVILSLNSLGIYEGFLKGNFQNAQNYFLTAVMRSDTPGCNQYRDALYINLAETSALQGDTAGMEYARMALKLGRDNDNAHVTSMALEHMANHLHLRGDLSGAQKCLDEALDIAEKENFSNTPSLYARMAGVAVDKGDYQKARSHISTALEKASNDKMPVIEALYQKGRLLNMEGKHEESNAVCHKALALADSSSVHYRDLNLLDMMSENYFALKDYKSARDKYRKRIEATSIIKANAEEFMAREREMTIKMIRHESAEAIARHELKSRNVILGLAIVIILMLVAVIVIVVRNSRKRNDMYKKVVRQNKEALKREKELLERVNQLSDTSNVASDTAGYPSEKAYMLGNQRDEIWLRLRDLMEKDKLYSDSQLNRENLADRLETNRTYLTLLIKEKTGSDLPHFINGYRIKAAIRLLSEEGAENVVLKDLWESLGFASHSTFFRAFKAEVGMSPSDYRRLSVKMTKNEVNGDKQG